MRRGHLKELSAETILGAAGVGACATIVGDQGNVLATRRQVSFTAELYI